MEIRRAKTKDLGKLQELFRDSILESGPGHYSNAQLLEWSNRADNPPRWKSLIEEQFTLLIAVEKQIVAFASLKDQDYFDFLYVAKSQQGKGYAQQLYLRILAEAKRRGASKLYSDVSFMAKPFFLARGFKLLHENENKLGQETLINFRVAREI